MFTANLLTEGHYRALAGLPVIVCYRGSATRCGVLCGLRGGLQGQDAEPFAARMRIQA
jgi:hypothetical protein